MSETLIIQNFGPIKTVELKLNRFNVLIGEQSTGKTTIAKLLAVCRYFSYIVENNHFLQPFESGLRAWGLEESIQDNSFIHYECKHYTFTAKRNIAEFPYQDQETGEEDTELIPIFTSELKANTQEFQDLLNELEKLKKSDGYYDDSWSPPTSFFQIDVAKVMDNPFYLPQERGLQSIFSLGKDSIANINDALFNQLANIERIQRNYGKETDIEGLDIEYKNIDGKGMFRKKNAADWFEMKNAPSGFKMNVPIILLLKHYTEDKKKNKTFIIDEPEISLFPITQNKIIRFLVSRIINYRDSKKANGNFANSLLLTTHSPYILTALNNLIYAYQTGKDHRESVKKIIEEKYWINPAEVSAYLLKYDDIKDGIVQENIIAEDGLIMAEKIDGVSKVINEEYDKMLDIQYSK